MEKRITAYVLQYLLKHRFESKAEMARQLDMQQGTIEKVFSNLHIAKASTIAFDRAIEYCAKNHISLDLILESFVDDMAGKREVEIFDQEAYKRLRMCKPENLTEEGEETFSSMLSFLRKASAHICPNCKTWCNPWDGKRSAEQIDCYIGHMAREILKDTAEFYTKEGAGE